MNLPTLRWSGVEEEDLIYILYKLYANVKKEVERANAEKKEKGEIPELYEQLYKRKSN